MKRTIPDGFSGILMAVESIPDAVVFLHGPGGCRTRHMIYSAATFSRKRDENEFVVPYYFGYPFIPSTYLEEDDFINGATDKIRDGFDIISTKNPNLAVIVESPGAILIGDNIEKAINESGIKCKTIEIKEPYQSKPFPVEYSKTLYTIINEISKPQKKIKDSVILLGLTIMDKDWAATLEEFSDYLKDMGLNYLSAPGAGASTEDLIKSLSAEYAVVLCPEYCSDLIRFYEKNGVKIIRSEAGVPIGFDKTVKWIETVSKITKKDPSICIERVNKFEKKFIDKYRGMKYNSFRIKGLSFSVAGTSSIVRSITEWMYSYLSMAPIAVKVDDGCDEIEVKKLKEFLKSVDFFNAFGKEITNSDIVFCEDFTATTMQLSGDCIVGIPIGYSTMGLDDVIPRPIFGVLGAYYFLDELLHGVRSI